MKLLELQLRAFGPFTDCCLDFSAGDPGFHVVFGANEAGKSSALRALRDFLYGIPSNTVDNFLHANQILRLGGRLRHSDGTELHVVRRKGQKNTLESADGRALPDTVLAPFLAGVTEPMFSTMFGLTHEALMAGGREILTGGGEVGQSLFSAAGGINLRQLHQRLDQEARALYLPTGQNPRVNKALVTYKAMKQCIEEYSLAGGTWEEYQQSLATTLAEQQRVRAEVLRLATEKARLERLHVIMPALARYRALVTTRQDFLGVILLPPEFADQRREAVQKIEQAKATEEKSRRTLEQFSLERHALHVPQTLLEQADAITRLQQQLGSHEKATHDRLRLDGQRRQLDTEIEALLAQLTPLLAQAHVQAQRLQARHRATIQALAQHYQAYVDRNDRAAHDVQKYAAQWTTTHDALQALPTLQDPSALRRAVAQARQQGDLEAARDQECTALQAAVDQAHIEITQMGLWSGTLEALECLAVPSRETVDQVETTFNELNVRANHLRQTMHQKQEELADLDQQLSILHRTGTLPSEEAMMHARHDRNQLWQHVQSLWLEGGTLQGGADMPQTPHDLAEAYVDSVSCADEVADRLRREAERVTRQATLLAQHERVTTSLQDLASERETLDTTRRQEQQRWDSLWQSCGITPRTPRAMRTWLDRHGQLVQRAARVRQHRQQLSRIQARLQGHDTAIRQELARLGESALADGGSLNSMLERSEAFLEALDVANNQRDQLRRALASLESELEEAQRAQRDASAQLTRWSNEWAAVVIHLGLHDDATPVEAMALIEILDALVRKQEEVNGLTQWMVGIDRDAATFTQTVASLVAQMAPDLSAVPAVQAAMQLQTRLQHGQLAAARHSELDQQITDLETMLQEAQSTIAGMTARLDMLCRQAGCMTPDDLPAAESRSAAFQQLQKDIGTIEDQLFEQGAGATLDQLIQDADTVDPDALPAQIAEIGQQLDALYTHRSQLDEAKGREEAILHDMDGSGRAADAAEQAQAVVAELREGVQRYMRVRLASLLLNREIERFRASHQGPILSRASALFTQLTLGSFTQLTTEYNDKDQPVLVGVRANDRQVSVDGMSNGTRDQLYLALRLASLEHYVTSNEPLPFVVDDILIHFDDQRAKVALQVLAQLSTRFQVIFFTHHYRLIELVQELQGPHVVQIHQLEH